MWASLTPGNNFRVHRWVGGLQFRASLARWPLSLEARFFLDESRASRHLSKVTGRMSTKKLSVCFVRANGGGSNIFLLPPGTVGEVNWAGPTHRMALAIHPRLLTGAFEETAHQDDIALREHWDLVHPHISALVTEMTADLGEIARRQERFAERHSPMPWPCTW